MIKNGTKLFSAALILCAAAALTVFLLRVNGFSFLGYAAEQEVPISNSLDLCSLNLNTATWEELRQIPGVGTSLAKAIIAYRDRYGNYADTEELMNINGMTKDLYRVVTQYVYAGGAS